MSVENLIAEAEGNKGATLINEPMMNLDVMDNAKINDKHFSDKTELSDLKSQKKYDLAEAYARKHEGSHLCDKTYTSKTHEKKHLPRKHWCKICGTSYQNKKMLEKHALKQHKENEKAADLGCLPIVSVNEEQTEMDVGLRCIVGDESDMGLMHDVGEPLSKADVGLLHTQGDDREQAMDEQTSIITGSAQIHFWP